MEFGKEKRKKIEGEDLWKKWKCDWETGRAKGELIFGLSKMQWMKEEVIEGM